MSTNKELAEENKMLFSIIEKINTPDEENKISYDKLIEDNKVLREALEVLQSLFVPENQYGEAAKTKA